MKKLTISLITMLLIATNVFAGAVSVQVASGASASTIQGYISTAVSAGDTDISLLFAKGGTWGTTASGGDITIAIPAGVTKLTFTYDPSTSGSAPLLCFNTLTYADALMTGGIFFEGVKLYTGTTNRYLIQPTTTANRYPVKISINNCWIENYRAVVYASSSFAIALSDVKFTNNIFKNIAAGGIISVAAGTITQINIRNNTFNNVGGDASGATGSDYFVDFRSAGAVTSLIKFSNNTIYYPRTQGRGLFRLPGAFTTGSIKENNNIYSTGNSVSFALQLLYTNVTAATTDADSTNFYSNKMTLGSNKGNIATTVYSENTPSNLFTDPTNDNFTINDVNFAGKIISGDPRWWYPATINVNPSSLSGLDYNIGTGPSVSQNFTISTIVLRGPVTITAPTNYEISTDNIDFSQSTIVLGDKGSDLTNAVIYVRLKSGLSIGSYNENINITSTQATTKTIPLTGSVTNALPVLDTPTGLTSSSVTYTGFHASWNAVNNASSYTLKLYQGASITTITGVSANSYDFTGLTPGLTYTYSVIAISDGINYNNSSESLQSENVSLPHIYLFTSVNNTLFGTVVKNPNTTTYSPNASVQLTATKNFGYTFVNWIDSVSGTVLSTSNPYTVSMSETKHIKAVFNSINTYNFTVNITGSQWGKVVLSPAATGGKYEEGTTVTMTVTPNAVTTFSYWEDATTSTSRIILVDGDKTFTATFDEIPFIVGWDFRVADPKSSRAGDYYAVSTNKGVISLYEQAGTAVSWLSHTGWGSPTTPCAIKWTSGSSFATNQRYYQASFSTTDYQNIQVKSQISGSYQYYTTQKLQASLDGTNYADLTTIDLSGNTWKDLNYTLPSNYDNQSTVYLRWIADATSTRNGNTADNDGTSLTNVFVFADPIPVVDVTAPNLVSIVPAEGAISVSANGNIVLTFDERVKAGTGSCTLESTVLTPSFGSKTATFPFTKLSYNTDYTFTVPAGALTDMSGNPYAGMTLHFHTMNRPTPTPKVFDAVVAKDGSGDYLSVIDAINGAPTGRALPWLIFVKNGTYSGHVDIPATKPYIHLIGQNRDSVIITAARLSGSSPDSANVYAVDLGASVVVRSANCYFENICFENKYGYDHNTGPQALALYTMNDRTTLNNCWLRSFQDTYLTTYGNVTYRHYLKNCRIEGAVDFIYGGGDVFFDVCTIFCKRASGGYIVAPSHQTGTQYGYVFSNCTIDGTSPTYQTYMGRPWANSPKASFFNTTWKIQDYPAGWYYKMGAIPSVFADYNSMDASGNALDLTHRISQYEYDIKDSNGNVISTVTGTAKNSFTNEEAAQYTYENVTKGADNWDPRTITETTSNPVNVSYNSSGVINWDAVPYAICYVIIKDNKVIGFTSNNTFTDASYSPVRKKSTMQKAPQSALYNVVAVAESGALSAPTIALIADTPTSNENITKNRPYGYFNQNNLIINNLVKDSRVTIYSFVGVMLDNKISNGSSLTFNCNTSCIVKVNDNGKIITFKLTK